jgi:Ethanolamine utilization protein EutJ (predicted chaperonin)
MQAPANLDLFCWQGANFDYDLTWRTNGTAVNLTGYSARMQVRTSYDSPTVILGLTSGSGITLGGTAGSIILEASATTTAGVPSGQYVYDLELITGGGYVTRLLEGNFTIDPEVTR